MTEETFDPIEIRDRQVNHALTFVIDLWLKQYNHTRLHQALNMRAPVPEILIEKTQISGPEQEC